MCAGVSNGIGSSWFYGRCGHMYMWREGSRILSLEDVAELNDVALNRALPLPDSGNPGWAGEVEAFFSTMQLTTSVNHTMWPFEEDEEEEEEDEEEED